MISVFLFTGRLSGGGSERVSAILANFLVAHHVSVSVVTITPSSNKDYYLDSNIQRICLSEIKGTNVTSRLIKVIKRYRPNVIISMAVPISLYSIPAAILTRTKIIISERSDPNHSAAKKQHCFFLVF